MKKTVLMSLLTATLTFTSLNSLAAEGSSNLGIKIAEKIITAVAGDVFSKIFGTDTNQLKKSDIADAINKAFEEATTKEINQMQVALANKIRVYPADDSDKAWEIMNDAGNLQALVETHISKGNSTIAIPAFVAAWNARLSFAAEYYRIKGDEASKHSIATEALHGLRYLNTALREDFRDTTRRNNPCIKKLPETRLRLNGALGSNYTEKYVSGGVPIPRVDVSTQYCLGNGRVLKDIPVVMQMAIMPQGFGDGAVINLNGAWYMLSTDMGKALHEDLWLFAGKTSPTSNDYFLEQSTSEEFANMLRNQYILKRYPDLFGDLHGTVIGWTELVKTFRASDDEIGTGLKYAAKLGIGWNTLTDSFNKEMTGEHGMAVAALVNSIRENGESREILD